MDVPYGFDCFAFDDNELKYFESDIVRAKSAGVVAYNRSLTTKDLHQGHWDYQGKRYLDGYVRFTRKNEDYTRDQLRYLARAGRLNEREFNKKIFCGIKIQIGIGVVANFMQRGLLYRKPIRGRSELINGSWTGIVSGLTMDPDSSKSYDVAFGNFLAYDEEFPYMKFGPFFAIESKLVMLTGSSRSIETSSFGSNMKGDIWLIILSLMLILSLLAAFRLQWQHSKHQAFEAIIDQMMTEQESTARPNLNQRKPRRQYPNLLIIILDFFFIYFTMLLNKPSIEFDNLVWPNHRHLMRRTASSTLRSNPKLKEMLRENEALRKHYQEFMTKDGYKVEPLSTSIRIVSYLWSAACLVMASIYSGEMLAVILLHTDQNIDTIAQLINSKPPIEPVIRQDDFTYNLMLKSLDQNMLTLHNMTKIIPRPEVYTQRFIEQVSERKVALLGDDELIETIYDIYHKHYPLYRSKVTYLQYPISLMYRKDLNASLEMKLRRGMVQIFEMGLVHRWYQAQKDTYIRFYDEYEKKKTSEFSGGNSDQKYKPLSMSHFQSFFKFMLIYMAFAFLVLGLEIIYSRIMENGDKTAG